MADGETDTDGTPPKKSKFPLFFGLVLALLGGGGGFYATWSGMILAPAETAAASPKAVAVEDLSDLAFVELDQMTISLSNATEKRHLLFRATLEVPAVYKEDVEMLKPRIIDVLNGYLRALTPADVEGPAALARLRSQMLRRIMVVAERERVNDLLVMEFVVN